MTTGIKRDLIEAVTQAQMDNTVRVLVFTGTGRAFCAGDDLKAYRGAELGGQPLVPDIPPGHDSGIGTYAGLRTISQQLNTVVRGIDKLTIAAINGIAIQTGFSLALSCDFRLAAAGARLGSATLRFGLLPDDTLLLPGHNYAHVPNATMAETRSQNTYLNIKDLETWKTIMGD
jgi:2-(1,2-epoxy-1,2-dihydrophenyl)acetyl-CoA isomerase